MTRFAATRRVVVFEAPWVESDAYAEVREVERNLWLVVPHVRARATEQERLLAMRFQLAMVCAEHRILNPILWWYSSAPIAVAHGMAHSLCVYEPLRALMPAQSDDLAAVAHERALLGVADLVLTDDATRASSLRRRQPNTCVVADAEPPARTWDDAWLEVDRHVRATLLGDASSKVTARATSRASLTAAHASANVAALSHGSAELSAGTSKL